MQDTIFTVKNENLELLTPGQAVDFFRELLWAEATHLGIPKSHINVSSDITTPDGGIDAEVRDIQIHEGQGIIKQGLTSYQIKTGEFSLKGKKHIKDILFRKDTTELKPRIKSCLDQNGTLIVVLFGWDAPAKDAALSEKFRTELAAVDPNYQNVQVEVFRQNQLIGFLKSFPSLALRVNHRADTIFQTHREWSRQDDMRKEFKAGKAQNDFLLALRSALIQNIEAVHIHVSGEPGIGKTRLVLEATGVEELLPFVIYCDAASKFKDSELMNELLRIDNQYDAILVIDECDFESRVYIWNKLKNVGSRIKLISIYSERENTSGSTLYFDAPLLDEEQISNIIQVYGIPKDQADRWSEYCSGSPRVAHVIGWNLKNNPEDLLASPDTVNIWGRYIVGGDDPRDQTVQQRTTILQHLALFKRFGYGRPVITDAQAIAKIIERSDTNITWARFQMIIKKLRIRKLLQGENTLYITPKALHIKLWSDWWETYANGFNLDDFTSQLSGQLIEWFFEMFRYAAQSEAATAIVKELLGENGPFQNDIYLQTELGARFFLALTEANPQAALTCLKRTVGTWSREQLLEFTTGRREIVWALERIALWREHFVDAAELLLALAEAENESWSNNASGIFTGLFSLGTGALASTQASPQERLPVLQEALKSRFKERRLLAIQACNKALEQHFFRNIDAEYQGLRQVTDLWTPTTYGELFDAYRQIWQLLYTQLEYSSADEQQLIVTILLQRAQSLAISPNLSDMIINTVEELVQLTYTDKKKILADVVRILRYNGQKLPQHLRQRWEQVKNTLVGSDFSSQMKRYVGMNLLEDSFDEQGNSVDQTQSHIEELVQQVIENPQLLQSELHWLVTTEAQNGYRFGYELGQRDSSFSLLPGLLEAQRHATDNSSVFFLGGYMRVLFEKNQAQWEEYADLLAQDEILRTWLPELTWRSGLTDRGGLRILKLAENNAINVGYFRLFTAGRIIQILSENIFQGWIQSLLDSSHPYAISIALNLYYLYYVDAESKHVLPEDLSLTVLKHQSLLQVEREIRLDPMDYYHWAEIGRSFAKSYPKSSLVLADWMLEYFGEDSTILNHSSETLSVLNVIAEHHPQDVWLLIIKHLGPKIENSRAYYITSWLRGESNSIDVQVSGALNLFPLEAIWQWVDEDVEKRAAYLARFVPKSLFRQEGQVCIAREVLMRYGERPDVRQAFSANYFTGNWWGSESLHYEEVKHGLLDFKKGEENKNVRFWIDGHVAELNQYIQQAKLREERDAF